MLEGTDRSAVVPQGQFVNRMLTEVDGLATASLRVVDAISSPLRSLRWPSRRPSAALLLLVAAVVFASPLTAAGAINFVQTAGATNDSASIAISQAFAASNT